MEENDPEYLGEVSKEEWWRERVPPPSNPFFI
jgi:hypothetical protein